MGLDAQFILLTQWRTTSPSKSVEQRLGETFRGAAVPITSTTLSNVIVTMVIISNFQALVLFTIAYGE